MKTYLNRVNKKFIVSGFYIISSSISYADGVIYENEKSSTKEVNAYSYLGQELVEKINKNADNLGIKWVKGGVDSSLKYNFSAFSALSETSDQVIFAQGRFNYNSAESDKTLNLGLGSRKLFEYPSGGNFIIGVNAFYDIKNAQKGLFSSPHKRYSLGLEFKDSVGDLYGNIYRRQSDFISDERVLNGYDFGFSTQIPTIPNSKLNISRYDFSNGISSTRKSGAKLRAEYFLTPYMSFGGELDRSDQNNSSEKLFVNFTYNFGEKLNQRVNTTPSTTKVWDKRYDEVIRENKVYLEKRLTINITVPGGLSGLANSATGVSAVLGETNGYDSNTMGAVTYSIEGNDLGATIDSSSGVVSLSSAIAGNLNIKAVIAANEKFAETEYEYAFTINKASISSLNSPTASDSSGGATYQIVSDSFRFTVNNGLTNVSYDADTMGDLTYTISNDGSTGATIGSSSGLISTIARDGSIVVEISTAGGTVYASKTFTLTLTSSGH